MVARGEGVGIVAKGVSLVVVADGIGKVDGVGGVLLERVFQFNHDFLACALDVGRFELRRRDDHLFRGVVHLYELVE